MCTFTDGQWRCKSTAGVSQFYVTFNYLHFDANALAFMISDGELIINKKSSHTQRNCVCSRFQCQWFCSVFLSAIGCHRFWALRMEDLELFSDERSHYDCKDIIFSISDSLSIIMLLNYDNWPFELLMFALSQFIQSLPLLNYESHPYSSATRSVTHHLDSFNALHLDTRNEGSVYQIDEFSSWVRIQMDAFRDPLKTYKVWIRCKVFFNIWNCSSAKLVVL